MTEKETDYILDSLRSILSGMESNLTEKKYVQYLSGYKLAIKNLENIFNQFKKRRKEKK